MFFLKKNKIKEERNGAGNHIDYHVCLIITAIQNYQNSTTCLTKKKKKHASPQDEFQQSNRCHQIFKP